MSRDGIDARHLALAEKAPRPPDPDRTADPTHLLARAADHLTLAAEFAAEYRPGIYTKKPTMLEAADTHAAIGHGLIALAEATRWATL